MIKHNKTYNINMKYINKKHEYKTYNENFNICSISATIPKTYIHFSNTQNQNTAVVPAFY